jgi:CBS domain containing-hemolysin-like protein
MKIESVLILEAVLLLVIQFLVSSSLAAFSIISKRHEDKVFPKEMKGGLVPRMLHRGRLHLVIALVSLEVVVVSILAIALLWMLRTGYPLGGRGLPVSAVYPVIAVIIMVVAVSITGFGLASRNAQRVALVMSYPLLPLYLISRPFTGFFLRIVSRVFPDLPRELATPFFLFPGGEESGEGFIEENGSKLMHSIVEFGVKKVREVMVPRIDVFALDVHTPLHEVRERVSIAGHSRVLVYDGGIDRVVGILYVKDLVRVCPEEGAAPDLSQLVRDPFYVPEGKKIDEMLREFQLRKKHMAVVVDEYGGTSGIVTLEDILEEIVGEIRDEYDEETPLIRQVSKGEYLVAGRTNLGDLNDLLKVAIPADEVDTLGGFLYNLIGRVPEEGEEMEFGSIRFKINRLDGQRIAEVLMELQDSEGGGR